MFFYSPLALIWKMLEEVSWNTSCNSEELTCVAAIKIKHFYFELVLIGFITQTLYLNIVVYLNIFLRYLLLIFTKANNY